MSKRMWNEKCGMMILLEYLSVVGCCYRKECEIWLVIVVEMIVERTQQNTYPHNFANAQRFAW